MTRVTNEKTPADDIKGHRDPLPPHDSDARSRPSRLPRAEELTHLPVVALVGRPNTGKSTLFNRLTHSRRALVASIPGVTRDRNVAVARYEGRPFLVVDTGGFEGVEQEGLREAVQAQALLATEEADVVLVVLDGRAGLNPLDEALVNRLRPLPKPVLLVINKIDTPKQAHLQDEFYALGVDAIYSISAEHGVNVSTLLEAVLTCLPHAEPVASVADRPTAVAIIGRPNVGKSSLLNQLVGFDRAIVNAIPGTTRDSLDTPVIHGTQAYLLVDTAGIRRRPKVGTHLERASVVRALRALERAEVGLLVIDAVEGMTEQDARIAGYAWDRGRSVVLVVNKWDAVAGTTREQRAVIERLEHRFPSLGVVPKLFVSAVTGRGVPRIWTVIDTVARHHHCRLPTAKLNQVVSRAVQQQAPPVVRGKRPRFFYATQTATAPPTVTAFTSDPERVVAAFERYLINQLRVAFALDGTPLRLRFRARTRRTYRRRHS